MVPQASPVKWREWEARIARFERAGRSIREFCAAEKVSTGTFWYWRRRLRGKARPRSGEARRVRARFTPVEVMPRATAASVLIRLPTGASVELPADRPELLRAAIEVLVLEPSTC